MHNYFSSIKVRNVPFANIGEDGASAEEITDQAKEGGSGVSNSPIRILNPIGGGATTSTRVRKKKHQLDEDIMRRMVDKIRDLSYVIR